MCIILINIVLNNYYANIELNSNSTNHNLFAWRNIRYLSTGGWVELDENLLQKAWQSAYHLPPHARSLFSAAIHNDTHFLSTHHVMDVSHHSSPCHFPYSGRSFFVE